MGAEDYWYLETSSVCFGITWIFSNGRREQVSSFHVSGLRFIPIKGALCSAVTECISVIYGFTIHLYVTQEIIMK